MIKPPRFPITHPDHYIECQEALERGVSDLIDEALKAGWTVASITTAIVDIADNLRLQTEVNERIEAFIDSMKDDGV